MDLLENYESSTIADYDYEVDATGLACTDCTKSMVVGNTPSGNAYLQLTLDAGKTSGDATFNFETEIDCVYEISAYTKNINIATTCSLKVWECFPPENAIVNDNFTTSKTWKRVKRYLTATGDSYDFSIYMGGSEGQSVAVDGIKIRKMSPSKNNYNNQAFVDNTLPVKKLLALYPVTKTGTTLDRIKRLLKVGD